MPIRPLRQDVHAVVLIPSQQQWEVLRTEYDELRPGISLGREFLSRNFGRRRVVFLHTGDDAVEAAVSAQYAVDRWSPRVLAFHGAHDSFDHVAARNGLELIPVEDLQIQAAAPQTEPDSMPAATAHPDGAPLQEAEPEPEPELEPALAAAVDAQPMLPLEPAADDTEADAETR
jgi:hypothetical protein